MMGVYPAQPQALRYYPLQPAPRLWHGSQTRLADRVRGVVSVNRTSLALVEPIFPSYVPEMSLKKNVNAKIQKSYRRTTVRVIIFYYNYNSRDVPVV